jgi:hypothetical protein
MNHNPNLSPDEVLQDAVHIIGYEPTSRQPDRQGWVTFWCPFHDDIDRKGHSGRPNFGVNLKNGAWNCFVCGRKGPSLAKLAVALGSNYVPRDIPADLRSDSSFQSKTYSPDRTYESHVDAVTSALAECRANFLKSPARVYASDRGVRPLTAAIYSLGYGVPAPYIDRTTAMSAYGSSIKGSMLKWFRDNSPKYDFLLIRDPDEAGAFWEKSLKEILGRKAVSLVPPDNKDPDEALLSGWWPSAI